MSRVCKDCPFFFFFSCFLTCMKGNHLKPTFHSPCSSNQKGVGLAFLRYTIALGYQNGLFIAFHVFFALVFASCKVIILIGCYIISEICTVFPKIQPNTFCLGLLSKKKKNVYHVKLSFRSMRHPQLWRACKSAALAKLTCTVLARQYDSTASQQREKFHCRQNSHFVVDTNYFSYCAAFGIPSIHWTLMTCFNYYSLFLMHIRWKIYMYASGAC